MPRRSSLRKADDKVGDEQMTDEKLEQLQDTSVKDVDDSNKSEAADDDEDEDEKDKFAKKGEGSDDDEDEDEDDDEDDDETNKGKKPKWLDRKLKRAVTHLATLVKAHDPSMRKEALFAKSMNGGKLSESEADELDALVRGRSLEAPLRERAAPQMSKSFAKAVQSNTALEDLAKGVAGSHAALCDEIDHMRKSMDEVHCLLAKAIGAMGETLGSLHTGQGSIATALDKSLGRPAHAPRSAGVAYASRNFNGVSDEGHGRSEKALRDMSKSANSTAARDAIAKALFQFQTTKTLPSAVQQMVDTHLANG